MRCCGVLVLMIGLVGGGCIFSVDGEGYVEFDVDLIDEVDIPPDDPGDDGGMNSTMPQLWWTSELPEVLYFAQDPEELEVELHFACEPAGCETECGVNGEWRSCESGQLLEIWEEGLYEVEIVAFFNDEMSEPIAGIVEVVEGIPLQVKGYPKSGETPFGLLQGMEVDCANLECSNQCSALFMTGSCSDSSCGQDLDVDCSTETFSIHAPGRGRVQLTVEGCVEGICETEELSWEVIHVLGEVISVAESSVCAVLRGDALVCWGKNTDGMLGVGDQQPRSRPTRVFGSWEKVAVGAGGTCAIDSDGAMWCWGDGRLVPDSEGAVSLPQKIDDGPWLEVSVGERFACGIKEEDSELYCWGDSSMGRLGRGPVDDGVYGLEPIERIGGGWEEVSASGTVGCGLRDEEVWCWGVYPGGDGPQVRPRLVDQRYGWRAMESAEERICGIEANHGGLLCRGQEVPRDSASFFEEFYMIHWSEGIQSFALGKGHSCTLDDEELLRCWGENSSGQLGLGDREDRETPQIVGADGPLLLSSFHWIASGAGDDFSCGIEAEGAVYCWGDNSRGQLGNPSVSEDALEPREVQWSY